MRNRHNGKTPQGRRDKHPHEAFKDDGSVDMLKAGQGILSAMMTFVDGSVKLIDMDEGKVTAENKASLAALGGQGEVEDEYFLSIRRRAG